jgi:hypothetical protein
MHIVELSSFWEAISFAATQEILRQPEGSWQCSQEPFAGPILSYMNPVSALPSFIFKRNFSNPLIYVYIFQKTILSLNLPTKTLY